GDGCVLEEPSRIRQRPVRQENQGGKDRGRARGRLSERRPHSERPRKRRRSRGGSLGQLGIHDQIGGSACWRDHKGGRRRRRTFSASSMNRTGWRYWACTPHGPVEALRE